MSNSFKHQTLKNLVSRIDVFFFFLSFLVLLFDSNPGCQPDFISATRYKSHAEIHIFSSSSRVLCQIFHSPNVTELFLCCYKFFYMYVYLSRNLFFQYKNCHLKLFLSVLLLVGREKDIMEQCEMELKPCWLYGSKLKGNLPLTHFTFQTTIRALKHRD